MKVDEVYTTPDQSHMMMEPHATIARWDGDELTIWSAQQIVGWARRDLANKIGVPQDKIRIVATYISVVASGARAASVRTRCLPRSVHARPGVRSRWRCRGR